MGIFNIFNKQQEVPVEELDEALKPFENRVSKATSLKIAKRRSGEGIQDWASMDGALGYMGTSDIKGYNTFYKKFIDTQVKDQQDKVLQYRNVARYPEVADVIEDIVNESTQLSPGGNIITLNISDAALAANTNISKTLIDEFNKLFYHRIQIQKYIDELLMTYYIDSKVFWENLIDTAHPKEGIIGIKKLPTETMDYSWNPYTNNINFFVQYMKLNGRMPGSFEEAMADNQNIIAFHPKQITFLDYGVYGPFGKKDVIGYLEKAKQPYNQLRLIETSIVIYRLVRAPERLVFKIDTGNMPLDRAMKFVNQVKQSLQQKVFYDPQSGNLSNQPNVLSILENFFLPQCLTLDTKISLTDSRVLSLENIIDEFKQGKQNYVYSINQETKEEIIGEIEWAGITRKQANIVDILFTNGQHLTVTPDHCFVLENGDEKEAQHLTKKDDLMPYKGKRLRVSKINRLVRRFDTGCITVKDAGNNHNFLLNLGVYVKNSAGGRGSQIESIGGNPSGFAELDDLHYFQKKLYRALKYPMSRIEHIFEQQAKEARFADSSGEIARDETKWGRFLKKHQDKFCEAFLDLFMIHLSFTGYKEEFGIRRDMMQVNMTVPNDYIGLMQQQDFIRKWDNYAKTDFAEFSKYWRMKRILKMTDEEIKENIDFFEKDKETGLMQTAEDF